MRIISCVEGEVFDIGNNVRVTILEVRDDEVVLEIRGADGDAWEITLTDSADWEEANCASLAASVES